jgi:serine/threonine protein phosphatase 1
VIVIGDVHGCLKTLQALIERLPKDRELCFVGDFIDRGPNAIGVVEFIRSNNYSAVMGNHEQLLCLASDEAQPAHIHKWAQKTWYNNGGDRTMQQWEDYATRMGDKTALELFQSHFDWMCNLPYWLEFMSEEGEHFIISHSNVNFVWDKRRSDPQVFNKASLWSRSFEPTGEMKCQIGNSVNIIGHTPVNHVMDCGNLIFIDTGCGKGGRLSAYDLETKEIFTQRCIDNIK